MYRKTQGAPMFIQMTIVGLQSQLDALKGPWTPDLRSLLPSTVPPIEFLQIEDVLAAQPGPPRAEVATKPPPVVIPPKK